MAKDVAERGSLDTKDPEIKAIVAANDNYEAGYHRGNAGGLDAIETDLVVGNIKLAVNIFGKVGTLPTGISIVDYEYEADLAAGGTTYTPPVSTFFGFFAEVLAMMDINLEWHDAQTAAWDLSIDLPLEKFMLHQSASQRLRIINDDGANANAIGLYGVTWTGLTDYEYEAAMASAATYTPPVDTFFAVYGEWAPGTEFLDADNINIEWYDAQNTAWTLRIDANTEKFLLHQSASQRLRVINDSGSARAVGVYGATWS